MSLSRDRHGGQGPNFPARYLPRRMSCCQNGKYRCGNIFTQMRARTTAEKRSAFPGDDVLQYRSQSPHSGFSGIPAGPPGIGTGRRILLIGLERISPARSISPTGSVTVGSTPRSAPAGYITSQSPLFRANGRINQAAQSDRHRAPSPWANRMLKESGYALAGGGHYLPIFPP